MKNTMKFLGLFLAALVFLPSCMRVPTYRAQPLRSASADFTYRGIESNVIIQAKQLNWKDKEYLFGDHSDLVEDDKFQVIYLSITNLSNTHYVFPPGLIDLKQVSPRDVAKAMKRTSSVGRIVASASSGIYVVGSLPNFPILVYGGPGAVIAGAGVLVGLATISLIGGVQGIKSIVMNTRVRKDIEEKILNKKIIIHSGQQYDGLMFVKPSDYHSTFTVTMHAEDNAHNYITFDVDLHEQQ